MKCPHCDGTGELNATLGVLIATRRKEVGLSQETVASRASISRAQLANIETDRTDVPIKTLMRIADALSCKAGDLIPNA